LGYGNTNNIGDDETPASAGDVNVGGTVVQLSVGDEHTCAVLDTGNVRCWGNGGNAELGYGNLNFIGDNETPASAGNVNIGGTVTQISGGGNHTCALLNTGNVRCWGSGNAGQLGYGNIFKIGDNETPASAGNVNVGGIVVQISAGESHTCALLNTGNVRCWGANFALGYGNTNNIGDNETPASAGNVNVGGTVTQISTGEQHTCALLNTGNVRCWGIGTVGQLGYGNINNIGDNETPASAGDVNVGGTVTQLSVGDFHNCVLLDTGNVRCWGANFSGELGYGNTNNVGVSETPASAGDINVGGIVVQISAGESHTCALLNTGNIRCWGIGTAGRLGYGNQNNIGDNETPDSAGDVAVF
jgi:alpha-tubulin suppressor-like RCC1 family protein